MIYKCGMKTKHTTSIRLSYKAKYLLAEMAEQLGITQAAVIELAIREKARRVGVQERQGREGTHGEPVHTLDC